MTTSSGLRLGVIGAGTIAEFHVAAARRTAGRVNVVAVCDVRAEAAEKLAAEAGARAFTDHQAMIDAGGLDAVVITVPHALHAPITLDAAAAGLHVLLEKPIATTREDAIRMIDACRAAGVVFAVGHVLRFVPTLRAAAAYLASGELGGVVVASERRTADYADPARPRWFLDAGMAGGGIVLNVGTHSIDKLQMLVGSPIVEVTAHTAAPEGVPVETEAVALARHADGTRSTISVTGTGLPFTDEAEIVCGEGAVRISRGEGVWSFRRGAATQVAAPEPGEMAAAFAAQLSDFARACAEGSTPEVTPEYALSVLDVALAVYESSRQGSTVTVKGLL
ncbi:Gfo/Idh/MocA family protein [Microtetraspora malaysiensis]|uniref:Gfo/Idh/MocA family protein n=1 Tax=Microtetraspora malaysiensis TaxID=161358 RepID=A0ABW6SQN4_9ACTN|nr:Gfo/Idh/MocA family oxidoreductase [Microtetraspora malaysiensis]